MAGITDESILKGFKKLISSANSGGWKWWKQNEYIEGKKFFDGIEHYDPDTAQEIRARGLKEVVINRTAPLIRNISNNVGKAVGAPKYFPLDDLQDDDNDKYASDANELGRWGREKGYYDYATAKARQDACISGFGCIEQRLNMEGDNVFGEPEYIRVPGVEVVVDQDASAPNMTDARDMMRARIYHKEVFQERFGEQLKKKFGIEDITDNVDMMFTMLVDSDDDDIDEAADTLFEYGANDSRQDGDHITVFDYQWRQAETVYVVKNPTQTELFVVQLQAFPDMLDDLDTFTNENKLNKDATEWELREKEFRKLETILENFPIESTERKKRFAYRAFIAGGKVIEWMESPFVNDFTYEFLTLFYDENKRCPYGYMRMIKDAQRIANSSFLHLFHALLAAPKPSVVIESDASDNMAELEQSVAQRDATIVVEPGAWSGNKIGFMQPPVIPTGFDQPLNIAVSGAFQATGHNLEITGQQDAQVSGILDKQRTERGYDNLLDVVENYRLFLKRVAQKDLYLFRDMSMNDPGATIEVLGKSGLQSVKLLQEEQSIRYAAIVEEAPPSFNQKQENVKVILEMVDRQLIPDNLRLPILKELIENADMSNELRTTIENMIEQEQQAPTPEQLLEQQRRDQRQQALENELIRANTIEKEAEAAKDRADVEKKLAEVEEIKAEVLKKTMEALKV